MTNTTKQRKSTGPIDTCADSEGGGGIGSGPPCKNIKKIRFYSNTGLDPLKNHIATKPAFNVRPDTPF